MCCILTKWSWGLALAPFESALHLNLGTLQHDRNQLGPAEQSFRKAIELRPDFALAYRNLGSVLAEKRNFASGWNFGVGSSEAGS